MSLLLVTIIGVSPTIRFCHYKWLHAYDPCTKPTQSEMESIVARASLYNLWNMLPWFIIKQTQTEMAKLITCQPPYSFAREWFHGL